MPAAAISANADRLPMQEVAVLGNSFERVADGVAVVQQDPVVTCFELVGRHDLSLDRNAPPYCGDSVYSPSGPSFRRGWLQSVSNSCLSSMNPALIASAQPDASTRLGSVSR